MQVTKLIRNGVAGTLVAVMPVSATVAAVRPSAAVPAAASTAVVAQDDNDGVAAFPWLPIGIIALTILLAIYIAADKNGDGSGNLSRA